jgi:hypothetical protein
MLTAVACFHGDDDVDGPVLSEGERGDLAARAWIAGGGRRYPDPTLLAERNGCIVLERPWVKTVAATVRSVIVAPRADRREQGLWTAFGLAGSLLLRTRLDTTAADQWLLCAELVAPSAAVLLDGVAVATRRQQHAPRWLIAAHGNAIGAKP